MSAVSGNNGKVKFGDSLAITGIVAGVGVVTVSATGASALVDGDRIEIIGVNGMTDANGFWIVSNRQGATDFDIALSTIQTYTSSGYVRKVIDITAWTITVETTIQNVTDSSSGGWEENQSNGFRKFNGTFEGFIKVGANLPTKGSVIEAYLFINEDLHNSGEIVLTSEATTLSVAGTDAVKVAYNFIGTDELLQHQL